jgi:acyl carrier protein
MTEAILANANPATSRVLGALAPLLRAHAPALITAAPGSLTASLHPALELNGDLGFDGIALAELAVAIEDALGIDVDTADLAGCLTVRDLDTLISVGDARPSR